MFIIKQIKKKKLKKNTFSVQGNVEEILNESLCQNFYKQKGLNLIMHSGVAFLSHKIADNKIVMRSAVNFCLILGRR